uniref:Tyrosine-protein kinase SRK3-like n=1 Tax=Phallusia mammillata TaxID=59560 RepID=A0A6F9DC59_9ASCI|nr:tyrosine-protein kinase SRK3-like [Phallusia mammillata]
MCCGDLLGHLKRQGENFGYVEQVTAIIQIADGMAYMESKKFIHCNLRAGNILVGQNATYKIADFGLARFIEEEEYCSKGTKIPVRYSHKSDVWSFGILLLEITTKGKRPTAGMGNAQVKQHVIDGNFPEKPNECDDVLYDIMTNCWSKTAEERPTFSILMDLLSFGLHDEPTFENEIPGTQNCTGLGPA